MPPWPDKKDCWLEPSHEWHQHTEIWMQNIPLSLRGLYRWLPVIPHPSLVPFKGFISQRSSRAKTQFNHSRSSLHCYSAPRNLITAVWSSYHKCSGTAVLCSVVVCEVHGGVLCFSDVMTSDSRVPMLLNRALGVHSTTVNILRHWLAYMLCNVFALSLFIN